MAAHDREMDEAIARARTRLFANGYEQADLRDVILVTSAYTAERIEAAHPIRIELSGPRAFAAGAFIVGVIAGALRALNV